MDELAMIGVVWLILAGLVAALAVAWNRSGFTWFMLSLLLSPLFGFLALVLTGKRA